MYRSPIIGALVSAASLRDAEEFALPELVVPAQVSAFSPFALMPQFRFPEYGILPDWGMGQSLDRLPSQADAIWNSLMSSFDSMMAHSMISMPEIDVGDDCVVTVRLSPETNVNDTDIKVYAGERDIELHITSVKIREWRADPAEEILAGSEASSTIEGGTSSELEEASSEGDNSTAKVNMKAKAMLRGFGEMASSTTIRRIPAPSHCDVFSESAKATLDTHTNSLLIKFPVRQATQVTADVRDEGLKDGLTNNQQQPVDLAPLMDKSPEKKGWWSALFAKDEKKTVPIVKREEF